MAVFAVLYLSYTSFTGNLTARQPAGLEENQILAITDRDYFPAVNEMLGSANSSIHMIVYSLNYYVDYPDTSVNALVEKLGAASRRGVDVKVVADEQATDKPVITLLKEKGINIKFDKKGTTTHAKLIIIDSKIIIIGSTNWSYYAVDKNHEANVAINSEPLARQFEAYFNGVWLES